MRMPITADGRRSKARVSLQKIDFVENIGFHVTRADVSWEDGHTSQGWGRAYDARVAVRKALAEATERYAFRRLPDVHVGSWDELERPLNPADFLIRRSGRLSTCELPFQKDVMRVWVSASALPTRDRRTLLADLVCSPSAFSSEYRERLIHHATTSGIACHPNLRQAEVNATFELVEHDAFVRHWLLQDGGTAVRLDTLPPQILQACEKLSRAGTTCGVHVLGRGLHPTFLAWAQHKSLCFTCFGTASGARASDALARAMMEAELRAWAFIEGVEREDIQAIDVRTPSDHGLYYATKFGFRAADSFLQNTSRMSTYDEVVGSFEIAPGALYEKMHAAGHQPFVVDLSFPMLTKDPVLSKLRVVRVLAPGAMPLSFGYGCLGRHLEAQTIVPPIHPLC